jgi:chemotaxis response regulator CheB
MKKGGKSLNHPAHGADETSPIPPTEKTPVKSSGTGSVKPFHIVGIGASAGGLEALARFLARIPPDSGPAFVVVFHLDPTQKGMMPELLQRFTAMKVRQTGPGLPICRRIAKEHGVKLEIESEPGKGTTVRVVLPKQSKINGNSLEEDD